MEPFLIEFLLKTSLYFLIMYFTGLWVERKNIKVNYTRKINHFSLLIVPYLLNFLLRRAPSSALTSLDYATQILSLLSGLLFFVIFIQPIRSRVPWINTAFKSIDRPEDRPYTLVWTTTQTAGNFIATLPLAWTLNLFNKPQLIFVLMLINGIGDGLAEPIGIRYGKHSYSTHALFTKKSYIRTLEGSLTVFITSILVILLFSSSLSLNQLGATLILLPLAMTVTEAKAPHTWDNPLMFLVGTLVFYIVLAWI